MDQAARGATALSARNYAEAIKEYTAAIAVNSTSPDYFIKRSTAYQRSSPPKLDFALDDAENAVLLAIKRAKRELIAEAQMRRAIVLFAQERYGDAGFVLGIVKKLNSKEKTLPIWEGKVKLKLKDLSADDEKAKVTVQETPSAKEEPKAKAADSKPAQATQTLQTPPSKIKDEWYQMHDRVVLTLLAKGVPKDKATVEINETSVSISFPAADSTYEFTLDPLYAPIIPQESSYDIKPTKVEVVMKKKTPGQKWHNLEGSESTLATTAGATSTGMNPVKQAVLGQNKAPAYPTSSKSGPKDWDKVAYDLTHKPKSTGKEPVSKDKGDDSEMPEETVEDLDDDDGDPAAAFFKKLYKNADPDTRRAMMKSYQESNGTVLSTNWQDVGKKKVETQPPDGMEARQWGE
jgi:suppressor of G2 allele of SKP1